MPHRGFEHVVAVPAVRCAVQAAVAGDELVNAMKIMPASITCITQRCRHPVVRAAADAGHAEAAFVRGRDHNVHRAVAYDDAEAVVAIDAERRSPIDRAGAQPDWQALRAPGGARSLSVGRTLERPEPAAVRGAHRGRAVRPLLRASAAGARRRRDHRPLCAASPIPRDSLVADFLAERGDDRDDLNVFDSRRGSWQVMVRAAFHSSSLVSRLAPSAAVAHTVHAPSGRLRRIRQTAERYRDAGDSGVIVAGARCGTGSSRDWAATDHRLLGVRALLASGLERIQRSNLTGRCAWHEVADPTDSGSPLRV